MLSRVVKVFFQFVLLILIQVLIVKNIELGRYVNPFVYVLFILALPFDTPKWLLLILGFLTGICIDMFYDTAGMHAAAAVLVAFLRPWLLRVLEPRGGYLLENTPSISSLGLAWFLSYSVPLIVLHHLLLFYVEVFHFHDFGATLARALVSSVFTLLLVVMGGFLLQSKKE